MPRITNATNGECVHRTRFIRYSWHSSDIRRFGLYFVCLYIPITVFALTSDGKPTNLTEFVNNFIKILNPVVIFVASFGFFGLLTGILKYVGAGGDEERLGKAKQLIIYGLLGMLIIFSFWGIANLLAKTYLGV